MIVADFVPDFQAKNASVFTAHLYKSGYFLTKSNQDKRKALELRTDMSFCMAAESKRV